MKMYVRVHTDRLEEIWEQFKIDREMTFKTEEEEIDARLLFLAGMKFAMDDLGKLLEQVGIMEDKDDECDLQRTEWIN